MTVAHSDADNDRHWAPELRRQGEGPQLGLIADSAGATMPVETISACMG